MMDYIKLKKHTDVVNDIYHPYRFCAVRMVYVKNSRIF